MFKPTMSASLMLSKCLIKARKELPWAVIKILLAFADLRNDFHFPNKEQLFSQYL